MACEFKVPFSGNADEILKKAKELVESQGGSFQGDTFMGEFSVAVFGNRVAGAYAVEGNILQMEITEKPMMVPCNMIESFLVSKLK